MLTQHPSKSSENKNNSYGVTSGGFKGALSGLRQFLATENTLKMMKNAFYFTSKARLVLKIFKFLSWLFGHVAKLFDWKDRLISNFMTA